MCTIENNVTHRWYVNVTGQLCRFVTGQPLVAFSPQSKFLGLISTGNKHAIATRGSLAFSGDWLWGMKDKIDRAFMNKFGSDLPQMQNSQGMPASVLCTDLHSVCICCTGSILSLSIRTAFEYVS